MIQKETKFVILTGAGISAESGIRTFRDSNGLWENHRIEEVATPEGWKANPQLVWNFYQQRRKQLLEVEPNQGHEALVQLENYFDNFLLVTQNVDDLHERAGSENLIHMHGELAKLRCEACHHVEDMMDIEHLGEEFLTCLHCEGRLRPHIVWFNE
ncbi:MAG: Sir2 family NAD-dependent protein deacetylase, partial [Candidatus Thermoplasmatota archaeon]|nr:Sir2 family NAD-dependent protein deacetylase [Candidatus Thermoplasmatota archaeon]